MVEEIQGGSKVKIGFDEEFFEVHLPPVGYCLDRMPDINNGGKPSMKLVKCEILGEDLPKKEQKFRRTQLPKDWQKWLREEKIMQAKEPGWCHPEAEAFRAQEWKRRINGVWVALGNKNNKPTEYVYLTGLAYFYFTWWIIDFIPIFRLIYLKVFYALQWAEDNDNVNGIVLSTLRRFGKTAVLGCWGYERVTRQKFAYFGMQAKNKLDAKGKFLINIVHPWRRLPEFFRPKYFDTSGQQKNTIAFTKTAERGESSDANFGQDFSLGGHMDYRETKASAYDQAKLHAYALEEPGKWEEEDVYVTLNTVIPATKENGKIIGKIFAPTTIEELEKGGDKFIELFEDSFPSWMKKNPNGKTRSGLVALFISAYEGYQFDEYGRSVVDDPKPSELVIGEDGKRILEGAKTILNREFKALEDDPQKLIPLKRKYPPTWEDAKSSSQQECHFNAMMLTKRLDHLRMLPKPLYVKGNFEWVDPVNGVDGDVEFVRDDINGRWKVAWLPDESENDYEGAIKLTNLVGKTVGDTGKDEFYPLNDRKFAIGTDPIRNTKTDDPRASKAAAYVFRKYDASVDHNKDVREWQSHNFVAQYLSRPDFDVYVEDMIKACRFWGCSILPEENVSNLRQAMESRGYGPFILFRRDFDDSVLSVAKDGDNGDKGVDSNPEVIDTYVRLLQKFYGRHINRIVFEELLSQSLKFRIAKHFMQDAVVGAGFTLIASEKRMDDYEEETNPNKSLEVRLFPLYDVDGNKSVPIERQQYA